MAGSPFLNKFYWGKLYLMFENYKDLLSTAEVSEALGVSKQLVRRLAKSGEIKSIKIGKEYRFTKVNLIEYVNG